VTNTYTRMMVVLVSIVAIVMTLLLFQWSTTYGAQINVGNYDTVWLDGFYDVEPNPSPLRWSKSQATIRFPTINQGWNVGTLDLQNGHSADIDRVAVMITTATNQEIRFGVKSPYIRHYRVLLPPSPQPQWYSAVTLTSQTIKTSADPRMLGVVLTAMSATPTLLHTGLPYVVIMWWVMAVLCATLAWLLGASWPRIIVACMIVLTAVTAISATHVVETLPHWHWFAAWLAICSLGIVIAWLTGMITTTSQRQWVVPGVALPVWCAIAWWLLPVFQMVLVADDTYIRYFTYKPWMGNVLVGLAMSCSLLVWSARRGWWQFPIKTAHIWLAFAGIVLLAIAHQLLFWNTLFSYDSGDFGIWLAAARRWVDTGVLYVSATVADNPFAVYKRPPFYIMLFTPFVHDDGLVVLQYFRVVNIALFVITMGIWLRMMRAHYLWWLAVIVLLTNYQPLYDTVAYGQTDVILLFCFTVVLWALRIRRDIWAGVVIAVLTMLKIYPGLLLVFFVIKRRWWALAGFVVGMIACNAIAIAVIGWDIHVQYVLRVLPSVGGTTSWVENQTIAGFVTRFFDAPFVMLRFPFKSIERLATVLSGLLSALVCVAALRDMPEDESGFAVQYAMFVLLMVVAIPVAWMHYSTLLILVFLILLWRYREISLRIAPASVIAMSFALIAFGNFRSFNYPTHLGIVTLLMGSFKFYAMMMLAVLMLREIWVTPAPWASAWIADAKKILRK